MPYDFYPRPPRGGRPLSLENFQGLKHISIHALREEGDPNDFQQKVRHRNISIHALREEGDTIRRGSVGDVNNFYPRPPRGGRQAAALRPWVSWQFLSTPSARRATAERHKDHYTVSISIHALREEGDARRVVS